MNKHARRYTITQYQLPSLFLKYTNESKLSCLITKHFTAI